jgi:hypothetical protein
MLGFAAPSLTKPRALLKEAWAEFSDLEETDAGVRLMLMLARVDATQDDPEVMRWIERLLPVAERLRMTADITEGLIMRSSALFRLRRPTEGLMILRGGHELAVANDRASPPSLANDPTFSSGSEIACGRPWRVKVLLRKAHQVFRLCVSDGRQRRELCHPRGRVAMGA